MSDLRTAQSIKKEWEGFELHDGFVSIAATHSPISTFQMVLNLSGSETIATQYQNLASVRIHHGETLFNEITGLTKVT